ncbi:LysR family transcriptional regulator [Pseudomonas sp. F1_0610]|uniref:LysR family transcriptional regulator n=1 Tax=Pseudomonas sp. F1_0610 TaxID=3114284 RepID=UPI0039C3F391
MDLANLHTFIAVAELGSFSLAGERLHLTQPAVSKRIAALEQQLNARLFDRIGRDVGLTQAGTALLPRARRIINELQDTQRALANLEQHVGGSLTLATSHHIGLHRLPATLKAFTKQYPKVRLDIRFLDSEVAYEQVLQGRCELAIITLSPSTQPPLHAMPIWLDYLDFVAAKDHPLSMLGSLTLEDLAAYPAVFPGANTFTQKIAQGFFDRAGITPNISMSSNYLETIKMMVSIGLAWSLLPRTMLDDSIAHLKVGNIQLTRQLGYIFHQERTLSNAAQAFMQILKQHGSWA